MQRSTSQEPKLGPETFLYLTLENLRLKLSYLKKDEEIANLISFLIRRANQDLYWLLKIKNPSLEKNELDERVSHFLDNYVDKTPTKDIDQDFASLGQSMRNILALLEQYDRQVSRFMINDVRVVPVYNYVDNKFKFVLNSPALGNNLHFTISPASLSLSTSRHRYNDLPITATTTTSTTTTSTVTTTTTIIASSPQAFFNATANVSDTDQGMKRKKPSPTPKEKEGASSKSKDDALAEPSTKRPRPNGPSN